MRTRAAVVDEGTKEFEIRELEVDDPARARSTSGSSPPACATPTCTSSTAT